jgi:hypothetical protein
MAREVIEACRERNIGNAATSHIINLLFYQAPDSLFLD